MNIEFVPNAKLYNITDPGAVTKNRSVIVEYGRDCIYLGLMESMASASIRLSRSEIKGISDKIDAFFSSSFFNVDDFSLDNYFIPFTEYEYTKVGPTVFKIVSPEEFYLEYSISDIPEHNTRIYLTRNELYTFNTVCKNWLSTHDE